MAPNPAFKRDGFKSTLTFRSVSTAELADGPVSGSQFFERKINFRCSKAAVRHGRLSKHSGPSNGFQ